MISGMIIFFLKCRNSTGGQFSEALMPIMTGAVVRKARRYTMYL